MTGRDSHAGRWLTKWPVATIGSLLSALVIAGGSFYVAYTYRWTPLQRHYLKTYLTSTAAAGVGLGSMRFTLIEVLDRRAPAYARDSDLSPNVRLAARADRYVPTLVQDWLAASIYGGRRPADLVRGHLYLGAGALACFLLFAIPADVARLKERRHGRRLRGPEIVSASEFTQRVGGDGLVFKQAAQRWFAPWRQSFGPPVIIPRSLETSHISIGGNTGTGKSTIMSSILAQVQERRETAVVYDPGMDYVTTFYRPERGDIILNPGDARSPYWNIGTEVLDPTEALTLSAALFPVNQHEANPFFTNSARAIFAFLLERRPTTEHITRWITKEDELERLLAGSAHEASIGREAPAQRTGVLASLSSVASSLQLCPKATDCIGAWSAAEWEKTRTGWIFITSTPETRARLLPLHSLWLDTLILRLMSGGRHRPKTWLMVDELATLNRLPQMHTALTEGRKSNLAVVVGFQGKGQFEARYGRGDATTMLSQPATKIVLRTEDPESAKWASDLFGLVETERLNPSRQDGWAKAGTRSYALARHIDPLILPSELTGLANLTGYLKIGALVTRLTIPYAPLPARQPALIPRRSKGAILDLGRPEYAVTTLE